MSRLFCFGLGYSAGVLADSLMADGWTVAGTTRHPEKAAALAARGITAYLFDRGRPLEDPARALAGATHVLVSTPPDTAGDPVADQHRDALGHVRWVGYLSTTGVYGDRGGDWVDETSDLRGTGERAVRRIHAERDWFLSKLPAHVFRLPGIYGPGRSAFDQLRAGRAHRIDAPGHAFSRIHVADIAGALRASMAKPQPGAAYNVADDEPSPSADVVAHAAQLLGVPPPPLVPLEQANLSPMGRSFYADNRRVRNGKLKRELGWRPLYPNYRAGLAAILEAERAGKQSSA